MTVRPAFEGGGGGEGRIAENILLFARALRRAGLSVGPARVVDAVRAVESGGLGRREDLYWTLHAVLVSRREDQPVFHEVFELFFRRRNLSERIIEILSPVARTEAPPPEKRAAQKRAAEALASRDKVLAEDRPEIEIDARLSISEREVLQGKDFAQMSAAELAEAKAALARLALPHDRVRTRRSRAALRGRFDPRRALRQSRRSGFDLILPAFREPRTRRPPVVALCDISGSMSQYSRILLHFVHALSAGRRVHAFVFGTRLTNITRQLRARDVDEALAACAGRVLDWSGGTRIGDAIHAFNRDWSRRVLGQKPTVLLITDGLDRGDTGDLAGEMDRLHRSCRRLIWLNPLLRFSGFEARASGIRAMLPHVDELRAVHSLDAIADLVAALDTAGEGGGDPRRFARAA